MMKKLLSNKRQQLRCLLVILFFYPMTALCAQNVISVKGNSMTLREAISQIEKNSEYTFFYNAADLKSVARRDIDCEGNIEEVLNQLCKGSNIEYMLNGKEIVLKVKALAQEQPGDTKRTITGTVRDANTGETLVGATVQVKGTTNGAATDIDGKYTLTVNSSKDILVVSFVGYKTVEQPVENMGVVDVDLPSDKELLNEVVVVGFGTQRKVSVVGAITSLKADELKVPTSSLTNAFAGRLAGVITTTSSGEPGKDASTFYIRGIGTFGGRATPLIMLDGVEISASELNYIPAESIESFSILKDASATAIYGARGANGVMLVTTKTGKNNERTRINISAENSFNVPMSFPDFADGVTFMQMLNEATASRTGSLSGLPYSQEKIDNTRAGINPYVYPNVNWKDMLFKDMSMSQRVNINVSGGGSKANYYLSLQANHDAGVLNTEKLYSFNNNVNIWNYTFQSNVDYKVTPTTKVGLRMNAQMTNGKGPNTSTSTLFGNMLEANPVNFAAYYPSDVHTDGQDHMLFGNAFYTGDVLYTNPYAQMLTSYQEDFQANILTTVNLEQDLDFLTKGLKVKGLVSFRNWSDASFSRTIEPYYYMPQSGSYSTYDPLATGYTLERVGTSGTDYITETANAKQVERTFQLQGSVEWARTFNGVHDLSAMVLYLQRELRENGKVLPTRNQGVAGRFTYGYNNRYLFEMNFGYNGTERLAKGRRFEFFPSFAAGWVISNEKFFNPLTNIVTNLKLRGSWGLVGNDQTGTTDIRGTGDGPHFIYLTDVTLGNQGYTTGVDMNVTYNGPTINLYGVQNATWERAEKINIGIDLELFSKLSLTVDIFQDNRRNILLRRERFPEYLGYAAAKPWASIGKARNRGVDMALNYTQDFNENLTLDLRGTFTLNESTLIYSDEALRDEAYRQRDGKPLNGTWGYVADRLFVDQADIDNSPVQRFGNSPMPGDIKYRDMNGDGMIDGSDMCQISKYGTTPGIMYGFGATVRYKNFDFGVFFQGAAHRTITMGSIHPFGTTRRNVLQFIADDYWTEENPNPYADYPRLEYRDGANNNTQTSTYWMRDGSYLRFKNAEFGYNFKFGRLYVNGNNLLTFSPFKLWDPELPSWNTYPLSRTFNVGVQFNL